MILEILQLFTFIIQFINKIRIVITFFQFIIILLLDIVIVIYGLLIVTLPGSFELAFIIILPGSFILACICLFLRLNCIEDNRFYFVLISVLNWIFSF